MAVCEIKHHLAGNKAYLGRVGMARGCEEAGELLESHVDGDGTRLGESISPYAKESVYDFVPDFGVGGREVN